jgi:hypothetical protein
VFSPSGSILRRQGRKVNRGNSSDFPEPEGEYIKIKDTTCVVSFVLCFVDKKDAGQKPLRRNGFKHIRPQSAVNRDFNGKKCGKAGVEL